MNEHFVNPNTEDLLEQGQRVKFSIGDLSGEGKIVGVANNGQPVIGRTYIIDPDRPIVSEVYPYSHFVAFESQLVKI